MRRRCLAEFIGTFCIVFAPVALSASGKMAGGDASLAGAAWASGLSVLAMIYAMGHICGAHYNPAVTLAFASAGHFPWRRVLPYCLSQFAGGIFAAALAALLFSNQGGSGVHVPAAALSPFQALGIEATLTFFLMLVIIAVATDKRAHPAIPGLAIGLTVVFAVWIGGPATGGSMNPARSFGPALVAFLGSAGALSAPLWRWWIYAVAPPVGAICAARLYETLRGGEGYALNAPADS